MKKVYWLMTVSVAVSASPSWIRPTSKLVPPMSQAITSPWPSRPARKAAPVTPPTGPDPMVKSGDSAAWGAGTTPPAACMISSGWL